MLVAENKTLTQIVNDGAPPARPDDFTNLSAEIFCAKIMLKRFILQTGYSDTPVNRTPSVPITHLHKTLVPNLRILL